MVTALLLAAHAALASPLRSWHDARPLNVPMGGMVAQVWAEEFEIIATGDIVGRRGWRQSAGHVVSTSADLKVSATSPLSGLQSLVDDSLANNELEYAVNFDRTPVPLMVLSFKFLFTVNLGGNPVRHILANQSDDYTNTVAFQMNTTGTGVVTVVDSLGTSAQVATLSGNTTYTYAVTVDGNGLYNFTIDGTSKITGYFARPQFDRFIYDNTNTVTALAARMDAISLKAQCPTGALTKMGFN